MAILLSGCNTGIESTKKITPSRADRQLLQPTAEDRFIDSIRPEKLSEWKVGKRFLIADNKASLVYEVTDSGGRRVHGDSLKGVVICFDGVESQSDPAGGNTAIIRFKTEKSHRTVRYTSNKPFTAVGSTVWSDLPMAVDLELAQSMAHLLKDRELWVRTELWYDKHGSNIRATKFTPVKIQSVTTGDAVFPLKVKFEDMRTGTVAYLPMNLPDGKGKQGSRSFASLFSLKDPKELYPDIMPEVWEAICRCSVMNGMTKEECKLALGNPTEVDHGHNWDNLVDYWKYADGTYLLFVDDKLTDYRK